jgi:hypothetical protein
MRSKEPSAAIGFSCFGGCAIWLMVLQQVVI